MSLAVETTQVNTPRRRGRPIGADADARNPLDEINNDGWEVTGSMANQWGYLEDISDTNSLEDQARASLGAILREQERVLTAKHVDIRTALDLCRRAQRKLELVNVLDAEQGLDRNEPVLRAKKENRRAYTAGKRIIAKSEPQSEPRLRRVQ
jgi:hypothetical protein